ncbi:MAG: flavodoxin family protein [Candidatus Hodarchaeota archaeon]
MKVLIVYDTKYGNTRKVAELIGEGLKTIEENEVTIANVKEIDLNKDQIYDLILVGSPNHMGTHTESVRKFIKGLRDALLKGKSFAVFDTYMSKDYEKAVKRMEKQINMVIPNMARASSGLSIKVGGKKGPIVEEDLPKCKEFGISLAK